jgi:hypothetical protein
VRWPGDPAWLLSRHTRLVHTEKVGRSVTTVTARVSGADRPGVSFLGGLVPAGVVGDRIPPRRLCQAIGFAAARSAKSVSSAHVLTEDPGRTVGRSTIPRKRAAASLKLFSAPGEPWSGSGWLRTAARLGRRKQRNLPAVMLAAIGAVLVEAIAR